MKRLLTSFLTLSSITLLMLSSCKKNDKEVTDTGTTSSNLSTSTTTLVLDKTKLTDTSAAITFNFTAPKFTFKSGGGTNSLEVDVDGDNWKSPASYTLNSGVTSQGFSVAVFDALMLQLKIPAYQATKVNIRVVNALSAETAIYSNVVTVTVTAFNLTSFIYVVGDFQGWSDTAPDSLISPTGNGIYTGIINFTTGNPQFLILPAKGTFNNKYATNDPTGSTSSTVAQNAPNNFYAPSGNGYYFITLNIPASTITFEAVNYYSVIGSSTPPLGNGFSVDNDMKYVNGDQDWELTVGMVEAGGFKIRQDHDWTWSWGTLATPDGMTLTDNNGGNIPITAVGNYKITFTIPVAPLSTSATPPVTAAYTLTP